MGSNYNKITGEQEEAYIDKENMHPNKMQIITRSMIKHES